MSTHSPVVFLIFNRPEMTRRVFARIAEARPRTLAIISDGPRAGRAGETQLVAQTRAIVDLVDWPCEVLTNFADENLGCKLRVSSGLSWVFEQFDRAIILEDDCLPALSFFRFCDELLQRYRDDDRVFSISGDNFQFGQSRTPHSYYFSKYAHCWGWATWRQTWQQLDLEMKTWPDFRNSGGLASIADSRKEESYWRWILESQHTGRIRSWGYPWQYTCWTHGGLTILPDVNLVCNLGFGTEATHTTAAESRLANLPTEELGEIAHPSFIVRNKVADMHTFASVFAFKQPLLKKWAASFRKRFGSAARPAA